ncbi:MAG: hypothetical protein RLZZ233_1380 [Verrucomicrobiota bacterium]|jgi:hypothetical protein
MPPAEEIPFTLLGPKPEIAPAFWASHWGVALIGVAVLALALLLGFKLITRKPAQKPPSAILEGELAAAETLPTEEAVVRVTRSFRAYLHAVDARALPSLSTEELLAATGVIPVFMPARQPLAAALRSADAAKFAGTALEASLLIAGVREAAKRIEDARRTFARPTPPPLIPPRPAVAPIVTPAATDPGTPPPLPPHLPVPPPLPRRDHA